MTVAICISCGSEKVGAWTLCPICASKPRSKDEAMLSLAMSEWFLDDEGRSRWAEQIQAGNKPHLNDASREVLSGFVTSFDEWGDVNAELEEYALEDLNQKMFEASDLGIVSHICDISGVESKGLVYPMFGDRVEIEGERVVPWGKVAPLNDLELLANAEYADAEAEYVLRQIDNSGVTISARNEKPEFRRNWQFFCDGTFFLDHEKGIQLLQKIEDALSPVAKEILDAKEYLRRYGIITSELGGDLVVRKVYEILRRWDQRKDVPEGSDWQYMIDIFTDGSSQLRNKGTSLVRSWIDHIEHNNSITSDGKYDIYRRVGLAALYRHSGQLHKALTVSEIVELPMNKLRDGKGVSVLCTTRAATFMDMADLKPQQREVFLKSARLTLDKANAMSGGESEFVREAYRRLKRLEADANAEKQKEREAAAWGRIGKLPPES